MRWMAAVAAMVFVGACRCGTEPEMCGTVDVTFETPMEGANVGGTIDVTVSAKRAGADVDLTSASLSTRLESSTMFGTSRMGTVSGNKATFTGVTLETGTNLVRVAVETPGVGDQASCAGAKTIQVTVSATGAPDVTSFTFMGDTAPTGVLNDAEITAAGGIIASIATVRAAGCSLAVVEQGSGAMRGMVAMIPSNGVASVTLAGFTNPNEGSYNLEARITCTGRTHDVSMDPEARTLLGIDRVKPTCMVMEPSVTLIGPADDADTTTPGFQLRTFGTSMGATKIELSLTGGAAPQMTGMQPPMNDGLLHDFTIPATGTATYSVVVTASDNAGNTCSAPRQVEVDFVGPVVNITSPADGGTYNMFTIPVTATVNDGASPHLMGVDMQCTSNPPGIGGPFPISNGVAMGTGNFNVGSYTISCTVRDAAGNLSNTAMSSFTVTGGMGCPISFATPATSPATLTRSSGIVMNNQLAYTFVMQTSTACAGRTVRLEQVSGAMRTLIGMGAANAGGTFQQSTMLASSGGMTLRFEATIDDGMGNMTTATVLVVVSLETPTIVTPAAGTLNVAQDLAAGTPGVQRQLTYSPAPPPTGSTCTICSDIPLTDAGVTCPDGVGFVYQTNVPSPASTFTFPDGTYSLKPVFVTAGGMADPGAFVAYIVDAVRPRVTGITFAADSNADNILNATELPTGAPVMNITFVGIENGRSVTVVNRADMSTAGSGTTAANAAAVTLSGLGVTATTDATFDLEVRVVDAANNANNPSGSTTVNPEAVANLRIDRVAPTCAFTLPNKAQLGIADDASAAAGYQVRASVSTSTDVTGAMGVTIAMTGGATLSAGGAPAGGVFSNDFTVASTGEVDYTLTATCRDTAGNAATTTGLNVRVDNQAPSGCMLTAPMGSTVFSNPAIQTTVVAANANGLVPVITSTAGGGGNLPAIASGSSTGIINYMNGAMQTVTATITDVAGNSCQATQVINVMSAGCNVSLTAPASTPALLNKSNDSTPGSTTTLEYTLTGTAPNCPNALVRLFRGTPGVQVDMATTSGVGGFSFNVSLPEGTEHLEVRMDNGVQPTFDAVDVTVDLTDPMISGVSPAGSTLFLVAPGNENERQGVAGYRSDANPGAQDGQLLISLTVGSAIGGTAQVLYGGVNPPGGAPISITLASQPVSLMVTLGHDTTGSLVIRVEDAAGNRVDTTLATTVDVVAPADPVLTANLVAGQERTAQVSLSWTAVGDDGATGTVTGYDVRWTTALVQPTGLATAADFFDTTRAYAEASGITMTSRTATVPTLNSYFFYVRAKDEVGNYSSLVPATRIDNLLTKQTFANPRAGGGLATDRFGAYMAVGKINNDAFDDLVVGVDNNTPNLVYVYYGSATGLGTTPQQFGPPSGNASSGWGRDVSTGKTTASSQTSADVLVGGFNHAGLGTGTPAAAGVAVLYFGGAAGQLDTSMANRIVFTGETASGNFGRSAQIIPDINDDGRDDIIISAPGETAANNRAGVVYLWYGRPAGSWPASPILASTADRKFQGPTPPAAVNFRFGRRRGGFTNIGRVGASGPADFIIPESFQLYNSLYLFSGATVAAGAAGATFQTTSAFQTLAAPSDTNDGERGFGSRAVGGQNILGGTATDLVASYPIFDSVQIYADRTGAGFPAYGSQSITITKPTPSFFGNDIWASDFTGGGTVDLFVGCFSDTVLSANTGLFFFMNRGVSGMEFDTTAGNGFFQSKISPASGGSSMGTAVVVGDFNNDSKPDVAASDHLDATGKVFVWQ